MVAGRQRRDTAKARIRAAAGRRAEGRRRWKHDAARKAGRSSVLLLVKRGNAPEAFVGIDISGK